MIRKDSLKKLQDFLHINTKAPQNLEEKKSQIITRFSDSIESMKFDQLKKIFKEKIVTEDPNFFKNLPLVYDIIYLSFWKKNSEDHDKLKDFQLSAIEFLLKNGNLVENAKHGKTPLLLAVELGLTHIVKLLLQYKANMFTTQESKIKAMGIALQHENQNYELVETLIEGGFDINRGTINDPECNVQVSFLYYAARFCGPNIVKLLLEKKVLMFIIVMKL